MGRDCQGSAPLPLGFLAGARWVVGHCVRSVGSRREWPAKIQKKATFLPSSPLRDRWKKMNSVVQNDTVLLFPFFFFFFECMKRRRFGENAPFHLNVAPKRAKIQISPQSSFFVFNCIPAEFEPRPYIWPRFSLWSLASELCN
jgi:hypothetical protein